MKYTTTLPDKEFFKQQVLKNKIRKWNMHNCSLCNYNCGYIFEILDNDVDVYYDHGCNCVTFHDISCRDFDSVIIHIKIQSNYDVIKEYLDFWNIDSEIVEIQ